MFCTNCGTEFDGKFCPNCGLPVEPRSQTGDENVKQILYDKFGNQIDLAPILGAYKTREKTIEFLQRSTNYPIEELAKIVDYALEHITPTEYSILQIVMARDRLEAPIRKAEAKERLKAALTGQSEQAISKQQRIRENKKNGVACCPKCGSTSLSANKKGFGIGKAVIGAGLTLNALGLIAGNINARKVWVTCLNCGHRWKL